MMNQLVGRLFVLDVSGGRVFSMNPDGSDSKTLVTGCRIPDGIVVDAEAGIDELAVNASTTPTRMEV